jgi:uncharacterized protein YybS (DUF2232 family)
MKFSDVTGCAGSALLLLFAAAWIPLIGPFLSLLTPLPFLYYTTKLGFQNGLKLAATAVLLIGLVAKLAGFSRIVLFCIEFGLLGIILSEIYKREFSFGLTIFWGTIFMLVMGLVFLFAMSLSRNESLHELVLSYFQTSLRNTINAYENVGWDREKVIEVLGNLLARIYPSIVIIATGFVVWMNVVVSRQMFRLGRLKYPEFQSMDRWRAPEFMVWFVIAAGFSLLLSFESVGLLATNALIVMAVIYVFHGLAIVHFFLNKYNVPSWIRFGVYLLIVFQQAILLCLAVVGLFDQWIDFRKIHSRRIHN